MATVTISANQTTSATPAEGGKAWHYLVGVLVAAISLSALTIIFAKFKLFHKYFSSYSHHLLPEQEMGNQDNDTDSVSLARKVNVKEIRNQVVYPPEGLEEDDGYIEDNYIQMETKSDDEEELQVDI